MCIVSYELAVIARQTEDTMTFFDFSGPRPFGYCSRPSIQCMHSFLIDLKPAKFNLITKPFAFWSFQFQHSFLQTVQHYPYVIQMLLPRRTMD